MSDNLSKYENMKKEGQADSLDEFQESIAATIEAQKARSPSKLI